MKKIIAKKHIAGALIVLLMAATVFFGMFFSSGFYTARADGANRPPRWEPDAPAPNQHRNVIPNLDPNSNTNDIYSIAAQNVSRGLEALTPGSGFNPFGMTFDESGGGAFGMGSISARLFDAAGGVVAGSSIGNGFSFADTIFQADRGFPRGNSNTNNIPRQNYQNSEINNYFFNAGSVHLPTNNEFNDRYKYVVRYRRPNDILYNDIDGINPDPNTDNGFAGNDERFTFEDIVLSDTARFGAVVRQVEIRVIYNRLIDANTFVNRITTDNFFGFHSVNLADPVGDARELTFRFDILQVWAVRTAVSDNAQNVATATLSFNAVSALNPVRVVESGSLRLTRRPSLTLRRDAWFPTVSAPVTDIEPNINNLNEVTPFRPDESTRVENRSFFSRDFGSIPIGGTLIVPLTAFVRDTTDIFFAYSQPWLNNQRFNPSLVGVTATVFGGGPAAAVAVGTRFDAKELRFEARGVGRVEFEIDINHGNWPAPPWYYALTIVGGFDIVLPQNNADFPGLEFRDITGTLTWPRVTVAEDRPINEFFQGASNPYYTAVANSRTNSINPGSQHAEGAHIRVQSAVSSNTAVAGTQIVDGGRRIRLIPVRGGRVNITVIAEQFGVTRQAEIRNISILGDLEHSTPVIVTDTADLSIADLIDTVDMHTPGNLPANLDFIRWDFFETRLGAPDFVRITGSAGADPDNFAASNFLQQITRTAETLTLRRRAQISQGVEGLLVVSFGTGGISGPVLHSVRVSVVPRAQDIGGGGDGQVHIININPNEGRRQHPNAFHPNNLRSIFEFPRPYTRYSRTIMLADMLTLLGDSAAGFDPLTTSIRLAQSDSVEFDIWGGTTPDAFLTGTNSIKIVPIMNTPAPRPMTVTIAMMEGERELDRMSFNLWIDIDGIVTTLTGIEYAIAFGVGAGVIFLIIFLVFIVRFGQHRKRIKTQKKLIRENKKLIQKRDDIIEDREREINEATRKEQESLEEAEAAARGEMRGEREADEDEDDDKRKKKKKDKKRDFVDEEDDYPHTKSKRRPDYDDEDDYPRKKKSRKSPKYEEEEELIPTVESVIVLDPNDYGNDMTRESIEELISRLGPEEDDEVPPPMGGQPNVDDQSEESPNDTIL